MHWSSPVGGPKRARGLPSACSFLPMRLPGRAGDWSSSWEAFLVTGGFPALARFFAYALRLSRHVRATGLAAWGAFLVTGSSPALACFLPMRLLARVGDWSSRVGSLTSVGELALRLSAVVVAASSPLLLRSDKRAARLPRARLEGRDRRPGQGRSPCRGAGSRFPTASLTRNPPPRS